MLRFLVCLLPHGFLACSSSQPKAAISMFHKRKASSAVKSGMVFGF